MYTFTISENMFNSKGFHFDRNNSNNGLFTFPDTKKQFRSKNVERIVYSFSILKSSAKKECMSLANSYCDF